jgi:hypothetical protein
MMRRSPKCVHGYTDVRGKPRFYFRRAGVPKVPLPGLPWSPEFMGAYEAAPVGQDAPAPAENRIKPGTLRALAIGYFGSPAFLAMKSRTRRVYRNRIEQLCDQKDANGNAYGDKSAAALQREHVAKMMAALAGKPESANLLRKVLRAMMHTRPIPAFVPTIQPATSRRSRARAPAPTVGAMPRSRSSRRITPSAPGRGSRWRCCSIPASAGAMWSAWAASTSGGISAGRHRP